MLVHRKVTPSIRFAGTHLHTWVERGTVRVKCLAQEHNTMTPARARTWAAQPRDERTNHEATTAPRRTTVSTRPRFLMNFEHFFDTFKKSPDIKAGGDSLDIVIHMWQEESLEIWDWHHGGVDVYCQARSFFSSMPVKRKARNKSSKDSTPSPDDKKTRKIVVVFRPKPTT